jgi:hypothetical protein
MNLIGIHKYKYTQVFRTGLFVMLTFLILATSAQAEDDYHNHTAFTKKLRQEDIFHATLHLFGW